MCVLPVARECLTNALGDLPAAAHSACGSIDKCIGSYILDLNGREDSSNNEERRPSLNRI